MEKKEDKRLVRVLVSAIAVLALLIAGMSGFLLGRRSERTSGEAAQTAESLEALEEEMASLEEENESLTAEAESFAAEKETYEQQIEELQDCVDELTQTLQESQQTQELDMETTPAGEILSADVIDTENLEQYFCSYEISNDVYERINGKSYQENPNISLDDLRYLKMLHYNFDHEIQMGEMIVNAAIAEDVTGIFRELFEAEYEVQSMYLIDNYWTGDGETSDSASIEANNTSAFCYRTVTGGSSLSNHAYGRAIDINPQQNPYVTYRNGSASWSHENANDYIDRDSGLAHVITHEDLCYQVFAKYGFSWGGDWSTVRDYQHFEKE